MKTAVLILGLAAIIILQVVMILERHVGREGPVGKLHVMKEDGGTSLYLELNLQNPEDLLTREVVKLTVISHTQN